MIRRVPSRHQNYPIAREFDRAALARLGLLLVCALVIAGGFLYAGREHFLALHYGYETENLRKVHDQLAEEQRRFLLEREAALSPARLERAARELGMQPVQPGQLDPFARARSPQQKSSQLSDPAARLRSGESTTTARPRKSDRSNKPI